MKYCFLFIIGICCLKTYAFQSSFGTIYSKNTWTNTTDFIANNNATATLSGNYINISSATQLNYSNTVSITNYHTKLSKWKFKARFQILSFTSSSYGIGFGVKSVNQYVQNDVFGFIQTSNTGLGGLYIIKPNGNTLASGGAVGVALNDIIEVESIFNDSVFTFKASNVTSGTNATLTYTYVWDGSQRVVPNTSQFALLELGGVHQIQSIDISSDEITNASIATIGDSKTIGYFASTFAGRYAAQLNNVYPAAIINAGGGDRITHVLARQQELTRLDANKYLLNIGSNDLRFGGTLAELQTNYTTLVSLLQSTGASVYHIVLPEDYTKANAVNMAAFKDWVAATYTSNYIAGVWDSLATGNILKGIYDYGDGFHLNQAGNNKIFEAIVASGKLANTPLPVKLISFEAKKGNNNSASIQWKVDLQFQASRYELLKSSDGMLFNTVSILAANASGFYNYPDRDLSNGYTYYKLKMTEADGTVSYSNTISVFTKASEIALMVFKQSPTEVVIEIQTRSNFSGNWQIIDAQGKMILQATRHFHKGNNRLTFSTTKMSKGSYFFVLPKENEHHSVRFIK
jgi:lysophospholipase L1-like esterase